jgi:hypothetical protein
LGYVLCYAEDLALVLPYQLLECRCIPVFRAFHERYVGVYLFRRWGLDGRHEQKVRKTTAARLHAEGAANQRFFSVNGRGGKSKD